VASSAATLLARADDRIDITLFGRMSLEMAQSRHGDAYGLPLFHYRVRASRVEILVNVGEMLRTRKSVGC